MSSENKNLLFETYRLHAELAERAASLREGISKLYASLVAGIIAASLLLHRVAPDTDTVWMLPVLGIVVSVSWMLSLHSVTGRLSAKHAILVDLEKDLPFDFLHRENTEFKKSGFVRRRWTAPAMPIIFLLLCCAWLGFLVQQGSSLMMCE